MLKVLNRKMLCLVLASSFFFVATPAERLSVWDKRQYLCYRAGCNDGAEDAEEVSLVSHSASRDGFDSYLCSQATSVPFAVPVAIKAVAAELDEPDIIDYVSGTKLTPNQEIVTYTLKDSKSMNTILAIRTYLEEGIGINTEYYLGTWSLRVERKKIESYFVTVAASGLLVEGSSECFIRSQFLAPADSTFPLTFIDVPSADYNAEAAKDFSLKTEFLSAALPAIDALAPRDAANKKEAAYLPWYAYTLTTPSDACFYRESSVSVNVVLKIAEWALDLPKTEQSKLSCSCAFSGYITEDRLGMPTNQVQEEHFSLFVSGRLSDRS